jgi:hypothetical protein
LGRLEEKGLALLCALAPDTGVLIGFRALQDAASHIACSYGPSAADRDGERGCGLARSRVLHRVGGRSGAGHR